MSTPDVSVPLGYGPAHLEMLLFRYVETLSLRHALRVLERWPENSPVGQYAAKVLRELPANYFQQPRLLPTGPRFVYVNGVLELKRIDQALPMDQLHPDSTTGCVGAVIGNVLSSPLEQRRLRPLNSFMIFRSFCAPMFPGIPQKVKSMAISEMWQDDTLKSHWAVLAKAYTVIRDHFHVDTPSLSAFVDLCLPLMGFLSRQQYLTLSGWIVQPSGTSLSLRKIGTSRLDTLHPPIIAVDQVVKHCTANNYAQKRDEEWHKHILENGAVFAVDPSFSATIPEPQNWVFNDVPQWPIEEFEVDEMYSTLDTERDLGLPVIYDPNKPPGFADTAATLGRIFGNN
ncbi:transcriptional regulator family: HMG [Penicillium roqueforti]|uniref:MAT1-1 alpha-domain mating-type protein n=2 Tax=Penicillium roqueforti TaxID=5082 RepID=A0A0U1YJ22_PENRO|nr:transcriptional regulator family: HMG [Penicillium roqueforti]AJD14755.1 MAT1-1 alpha-domain mating-type protein [Penicillium roqueforti]KAF9245528.1 transcriptional regulator family: HMG [Penicillium roqueforti]KAI1832930.1 transcriptional regulator family: HMG [Penicillium roqueforti]KAI2675856.1 transcriptional regulator family: HMG [Penicillium roqueforti]KAI2694677.1 transcriptional regulator family: HMG [Penicillium roqueforti]